MPKVWNIGNTTVRNPKRIERALRVFLEEGFSGNAMGPDRERKLHEKLKEREILEFGKEAADWTGRKWRAAFYQLGFITDKSYKIPNLLKDIGLAHIDRPFQITPAGEKLIDAKSLPEIEDIYLRQFACYELPTSLESGFPPGSRLKPFILFVQVLLLLKEGGHAGLTRLETGLFIQPFQNHTPSLAADILKRILLFRSETTSVTPAVQKKVVQKYLDELRAFAGINPGSVVNDYTDTTFRYFMLSGLFTRINDTITIRPNRFDLAKALVANEPDFKYYKDPLRYFDLFYKNTYALPSDEKAFALKEISAVKKRIRDPKSPLFDDISAIDTSSSIEKITEVRYKAIEYDNWLRESDFAKEQGSNDSITDILSYLKKLNNEKVKTLREIDDEPAFLEWAVWRSFLAINEIVTKAHECRRFQVDEDLFPRNTAPGGGADMIFEFETYVLAVEVTMTTSHRQMAVESEPVRRHTVQYKEKFPDKDVYCLFIAPEVDNNVMETFRIGVWYKQDREEFVNVIPMSISDFIKAFETSKVRKFRNTDFMRLLDRCLALRNARAPVWKSSISKEIGKWKEQVIKS